MDTLLYGLTRSALQQLAYEYAEQNHISHPFKKGKAGSGWIHGFMTRHPELSLRKPEPISIARATGFNRPQVNRFFQLLEDVLHQYHFDSSRIFNCDVTGKCPDYNV